MGAQSAVMTSLAQPGLLQTPLAAYRCPSDTAASTVDAMPQLSNGYMVMMPANTTSFGRSNYAGVAGANNITWMTPPTPGSAGGAFSQNSLRRFRDFTDGLSNSFLVGERRSPGIVNGMYVGGDTIWAGVGCDSMPQGMALHLGDCNPGDPLNFKVAMAPDGNMSPVPYSGFSSPHSGGGHFLIGDGTVRFINESIANGPVNTRGSTYQNLATLNDGQPLGEY